jgi:hypothetical protein
MTTLYSRSVIVHQRPKSRSEKGIQQRAPVDKLIGGRQFDCPSDTAFLDPEKSPRIVPTK